MSSFRLFVVLLVLNRADSIRFKVTKELMGGKVLPEEKWSYVYVRKNVDRIDNSIIFNVEVRIPVGCKEISPGISVFFANDIKNILQIDLSENVTGIYHSCPYRAKRTTRGPEVAKTTEDDFNVIRGSFPGSWLPKNCTRISASVTCGQHSYNFYGLTNYKISIPDVMVVEEYMKFNCDASDSQ